MKRVTFTSIESLIEENDFIIIDKAVYSLFFTKFPIEKFIFIDFPESEKTIKRAEEVCDLLIEKGITRKDQILAIGGGATSDLAGFVASIILRGISWSVIPTTLLAMVDAAIGGKVGVNSKLGKNLIGQFLLPKEVFLCSHFLETLSENEILSGKGEILKYAFLEQSVKELILKEQSLDLIIDECAKYKEKIVFQDLRESGQRAILNLGHTFGHAFEKITELPHGLCVALGIKFNLKVFKQSTEEFDKLVDILKIEVERLPVVPLEDTLRFMLRDKKNRNNKVCFIIENKQVFFSKEELVQKIEESGVKDQFFL